MSPAGLLKPPRRTPAGYRSYDGGAVDRLPVIQGAQRLDLRPADIRSLLEIRNTGRCPCEPAGELLRRRLGAVDAEITRLVALRAEMAALPAAGARQLVPAPREEVNRRDRLL